VCVFTGQPSRHRRQTASCSWGDTHPSAVSKHGSVSYFCVTSGAPMVFSGCRFSQPALLVMVEGLSCRAVCFYRSAYSPSNAECFTCVQIVFSSEDSAFGVSPTRSCRHQSHSISFDSGGCLSLNANACFISAVVVEWFSMSSVCLEMSSIVRVFCSLFLCKCSSAVFKPRVGSDPPPLRRHGKKRKEDDADRSCRAFRHSRR